MSLSALIQQSLAMYGLAIVISMLVACVIWGIVYAISRSPVRAKPAPVAIQALPSATSLPPAHLAAIAGVVAHMLGRYRIVHIEDPHGGGVWTSEGKFLHQTSHAVRNRWR